MNISDIPQFSDSTCCEKYLKDNKHNSLHLALKILPNGGHCLYNNDNYPVFV